MKEVIIIGSGISGIVCAVRCAQRGLHATLVSPFPSERSQSVMAAGGINAVTDRPEPGDSIACHKEDTLRGGCFLGGRRAVTGMCESAGEILRNLEKTGTVFSVDSSGRPLRRAFGGQSCKRTYYCGASTGKQIVSSLVMEARRYEAAGLISRRLRCFFHSALIHDGVCYGALLYDAGAGSLEAVCADALVIATGGQNALDVIDSRLPEVRDICAKYGGIDVYREPIPVRPSVHFFMGGLAVHLNHETNIQNLFAVGECASMYHGANRLGGNSLLAAIYSGKVAADEIAGRGDRKGACPDFSGFVEHEKKALVKDQDTQSRFPVMYIREMLAETMQKRLGIVRDEDNLARGLEEIDYYLSIAGRLHYDPSVMPYSNYSLTAILTLARATMTCALFRRESRGAHFRKDFQETDAAYQSATIIACQGGKYSVRQDKECTYEN